MSAARVLLLDHRDSFVHLLADQISRLGADVDVARTGMPLPAWQRGLAQFAPDLVVLSPGPGHPREAELAHQWLATRPQVPVFGVCLGHQVIAQAAGWPVVRGPAPVHGEASEIEWHEHPFLSPLPTHMPVGRYHSLVVAPASASHEADARAPLRVLATAAHAGERIVMALAHTELPQLGVQFHPESVLTPNGQDLLRSVLAWAAERGEAHNTNRTANKMTKTEVME